MPIAALSTHRSGAYTSSSVGITFQPIEPAQLIIKLWARRRFAVRQIRHPIIRPPIAARAARLFALF